MIKEDTKKIIWALLIVFPFIFGFLVFNAKYVAVDTTGCEECSPIISIQITEDMVDKPSPRNSFVKIFSVPFDFKYYDVYAYTESYFINEKTGERIGDTSWNATIDGEYVSITNKPKIIKHDLKINDTSNLNRHEFILDLHAAPEKMTKDSPAKLYTGGIKIYFQPNIWDVLAKTTLFAISWMALCLMCSELIKKFKNEKTQM